MLSIIISTYKPHLLKALEQNITETIGETPYEIIAINNPGLMGICKAYNQGAELSKFKYLIFCHEDIIFHTNSWGEKIIKHLQKPQIGTIGIAGSSYVPKAPHGWHLPNNSYNFINIIQHEANIITHHKINSPIKAYALDGVFLAISKEKFNKLKFNDDLTGFHGYDLDFTLRSALRYENYVINDVLLEHFSIGNADEKWFTNNIKIREQVKGKFQKEENKKLEEKIFLNYFSTFFKYNKLSNINLLKTIKYAPSLFNKNIFKLYYYHFRYKKEITNENMNKY